MGADRTVRVGNSEDVIDVVPVGQDQWLARCECGETERFADAASGWRWVLGHPCSEVTEPNDVVDLTDPQPVQPRAEQPFCGGSGI